MDIQEKLKQAGFNVPEKPQKVDTAKLNLLARFEQANTFIDRSIRNCNLINDAPDQEESWERIDSTVLNYQRYCESLKDILIKIYNYKGIQLSENKSLSEVVRKIPVIINTMDKNTHNALIRITVRNDAVHDYMNTEYYDETIVHYVINDGYSYKKALDILKQYCEKEGILYKIL